MSSPAMTSEEQLADLERRHDDEPEAVGAALETFDPAGLSPASLDTYAFLLNHVLGEKQGRWDAAYARLAHALTPDSTALGPLRHLAVAARHAGDATAAQGAIDRLAAAAEVDARHAATLVALAQLNFAADRGTATPVLAALARQALARAPSRLDAAFAASFNNVTNGLYYATLQAPLSPALAEALSQGADAAAAFWRRAGGWLQHERAEYLRAKVALRVGNAVAAIHAAEHALALVRANGDDPVEKAFLLQLLAAAAERAGDAARAAALRTEVAALAASLDASLRDVLAQDAAEVRSALADLRVAFIGGGNMATALIQGLLRAGAQATNISVVEPVEAQRGALHALGVRALAAADASLRTAAMIVLAVKPQMLHAACTETRPHLSADALVVSVAAGIRASNIARWLGTQAIVRCMPNTPALIGAGVTGMAALPSVAAAARERAEAVLRTAGPVVWFDDEAQLDAVTAVSGSGPAYVFYFIEALLQAGTELGFTPAQARALALATFTGAAQLAAQSDEPPGVLRERVTSKGGTTAAALTVLREARVDETIVRAVRAADARARAMADEFGRD